MTKATLLLLPLVMAAVLYSLPATFAEKGPISPSKLRSKATHILTGKVQAVYSRKETKGKWAYTRYIAEIAVSSVEKGEGLKKGRVAYVRYWSRRYLGPITPPSTAGHGPLPRTGDSVRAFVVRNANDDFGHVSKDGGLDALGPNGIEKLKAQAK